MFCDTAQILTAYEKLKMSPAEIANDMNLDEVAVKTVLLQFSGDFNDNNDLAVAKGEEPLFSKFDATAAAVGIKQLADSSEVDAVKLKANMYIIDEYKGRNDMRALKENKFNITVINEAVKRARIAMDRAKSGASKTIELEAVAA